MTVVVDTTGTPVLLDRVDADRLLTLAEDAETRARVAERDKFRLAARWCAMHQVDDLDQAAWWGQVGGPYKGLEDRVGSAGTPMLAEFAVEPFAAALKISSTAGIELLCDVLDLQHRLPKTWARVESLEVPGWRARRVAQATRSLSVEAAAYVDEQVSPIVTTCGVVKIDRIVTEAAAKYDPVTTAEDEADEHQTYDVRLNQGHPVSGTPATSTVDITGDTPTLTRFTDLVDAIAARLLDPDRDGYRAEDLGRRKVMALGILCDLTQRVLDADAGAVPADHPFVRSAGQHSGAQTRFFLHFTLSDVLDPLMKVGTIERLGPLTTAALSEWIDLSATTITPVLDMNRADAVDGHDPPAWMADLVRLRDRQCVYPFCNRDSRHCDLDHIEEYVPIDDGGPPGQTNPENLAPLCRRHHRLKTTRRWRYRRDREGSYTWRSAHGRYYTVTPDGQVRTH